MKKWILNLVLAIAVLFFGGRIYDIWSQPDPLPREAAGSQAGAAYPVPPPPSVHHVQPSAHYDVITQKNLFSSQRGRAVEAESVVKARTAEESRFARNIALYGVVLREDWRRALVSTGSGPRTRSDSSWVEVGDKLGQVTVIGIERDRIHVREGSSNFEIRLDDRGYPSKRVQEQRAESPTVVTSKEASPDPRRIQPPVPLPAQPNPRPPGNAPAGIAGNSTEG